MLQILDSEQKQQGCKLNESSPVLFNLIIFRLCLPTSTRQVCTCSCSTLVPALQERIRIAPWWEISHLNCCENITPQGTTAGSRDNEEDKIERSAFLRTPPLSSSPPYSLTSLYLPRRCTNYSPQAVTSDAGTNHVRDTAHGVTDTFSRGPFERFSGLSVPVSLITYEEVNLLNQKKKKSQNSWTRMWKKTTLRKNSK